MKRIIVFLLIIGVVLIAGVTTYKITTKITTAKLIKNIEIMGVDEIDNGIITLKIDGQYYDYTYEYNENFKTIQERIKNGENIDEWAEIIY